MRRTLRVLVVEDERRVRLLLKHALRRAALGLVTASLVLAAAPRAAADEPRVVGIGLLANEATPESGPVLRRVLRDQIGRASCREGACIAAGARRRSVSTGGSCARYSRRRPA